MPTNPNMVAIQTVTVGAGGAANIEFTNIPQTYTDLYLLISVRGDFNALGASYKISFNGSNSNFTIRALEGNGSSVSSFTGTQYIGSGTGLTATASTFSNGNLYIPNYTSTTTAKSFSVEAVTENNGTEAYSDLIAGLWNPATQAAITSLALTPTSGNFVQYSTATLYGVTSAGTAAKATGGIITMDDNYIYHTFLASGTFTPTSNITADYLVVAGGGGGSRGDGAGGGGAGGLRCTVTATGGGGSLESPLSLTANTAYTVTIGAGGAGITGAPAIAASGNNSVFGSITSTGGGGGANGNNTGANGGSGGGGGNNKNGGTGTANQGYAGGNGAAQTNDWPAGGGGGAGQAGANATTAQAGAGGNGVATSISGSSVTYAGGGGSTGINSTSNGGTGGGGNAGGGNNNGGAGTVNTGSGGGAARNNNNLGGVGGNGGSGIVIVRYAR